MSVSFAICSVIALLDSEYVVKLLFELIMLCLTGCVYSMWVMVESDWLIIRLSVLECVQILLLPFRSVGNVVHPTLPQFSQLSRGVKMTLE